MAEKFQNITDLGGLDTHLPEDKISDRNASDITNIDLSSPGFIQTSGGYDIFANEVSGAGTGIRGFLFKKNFGTFKQVKLRVRSNGTNNILEWHNPSNSGSDDGEWEELITNLTSGELMGFSTFNTSSQNLIVMCDAVMNLSGWNGATATFASDTSNTIVCSEVLANEGFDTNGGTVVLNSVTYTYTGISNKTFTGVTPNPTATSHVAGDGVAQSVDTTTYADDTLNDTSISFTANGAGTADTINDSNNQFVTSGFRAGMTVVVSGSTSNDGTYVVDTVAAGALTLKKTYTLTTEAAGDDVTITQQTYPRGNVLLTAAARLWMAGDKTRPSTLYISAVGAPFDFNVGTNPNNAQIEDFPDGGGPITLLDSKDNRKIIIHKQDGILQFEFEYTASAIVPNLDVITLADDSGATNLRAGAGLNNVSYFTTGVEGLKSLARAIDGADLNLESVTDVILPTIENYDFSSAASVYYPKKRVILAACKSDSDQTANDRVIAFYIRRGSSGNFIGDLSIYDSMNVADWILDGKDLYFLSSVDQNTYKAFSRDSRNGSGITHRYTTKAFTFGEPGREKEFSTLYVEGLIKAYTKLKVSVLYGILGTESTKSRTLEWNDSTYVTSQTISALGTDVIGTTSLGASSTQIQESYAFSVPIHCNVLKTTRYKIAFETVHDDETNPDGEVYWAISNIATNPSLKNVNQNAFISMESN